MKDNKCINFITANSWHHVSAGNSGRSLADICAAHAAGHLVMSWLLDLHAFECSIGQDGDTSVAVCSAEPLTVHQDFLFTCAGIVAADSKNEIDDLLDSSHLKMPEHFSCPSDSAAAASKAATLKDKDRFQFVSGCVLAISQLLKITDMPMIRQNPSCLKTVRSRWKSVAVFGRNGTRFFTWKRVRNPMWSYA